MFSDNRNDSRQVFIDCFAKCLNKAPLSPLELQIADIIQQHPEYHQYLNGDKHVDQDFTPERGETNPFLHMSLHLAVLEQISTNRPSGITDIYQTLCQQHGPHKADHLVMEQIAEQIWQVMRNNTPFNDQRYLDACRQLTSLASRKT